MLSAIAAISSYTDRQYLDALYRQNYTGLLQLAISILHNEPISGDVVSNAMLSLFSKIGFLRSLEEPERMAYLRATVRNAAYKQYNAQNHRNLSEVIPYDSALFSLPGPESTNPAVLIQQREEYQQVRDAIASLPKADRQILYLKYSAQLTAKEIAEMTSAPSENAVNIRLSRARHKVLLLLQGRGWAYDG